MVREYAAFISYRHKPLDMAVATKLHKSIERFKIPKDLRREARKNPGEVFTNWETMPPERLLVFRDREELPLSNNLTADIFDALDNAKCLIVICTPDTPHSLWVRREISHFIEKHGRERIITVLAAGTPEESIPKEITARFAEDGVTVLEEYEPLVAYLTADTQRETLKKLDKELLRVCAALLGCPYDSLKQRHKRRKMQQALAVAAAAFLVALSFIGILVNRNLEIQAQKREVEEQKQQVELQKQEAENQRRMVQLRESELLAADARAALESGNTREAIEKAISALPKPGDEDRPYYAPAEAVLLEAMDVMGGAEETVILRNTVVEQMTPVYAMDISTDGTRLVTLDKYGVLHCYDSAGGQEVWADIITTDQSSYSHNLRISEDDQYLISVYADILECRELAGGRLLWQYDMNTAVEGYFIYDDDRNRVALLHNYSDGETKLNILKLEILSAATGRTEQEILLEQQEKLPRQTIHHTSQPRLPDGGVFSDDGRYFACAFSRVHDEEGKLWLMCYTADLQEGTVSRYQKELPYGSIHLAGMRFYEDGLVVAAEPKDDDEVAGVLLKLDVNTNRLLWQTTTPAELDEGVLIGERTAYALLTEQIALVARNDKMYAIELEKGGILHSVTFPGILTALYPAGDTYFGFSLKDGTYAIGWYSTTRGFTLTTDNFLGVSCAVGSHELLQIYGGGIVQYYSDGSYMEISVSNVDRPGYLVVVPKDNPNQLVIKRPVVLEKVIAPTFIPVPLETDRLRGNGADCVELDDTLMLGQFRYDDKDGKSHVVYLHMDPATEEITGMTEVQNSSYEQYHFLHDGSGYINVSWNERAVLFREGGETMLVPRYAKDDASAKFSCDSAYLQDGTVLTTFADRKILTVFEDGVQTISADLPEAFLDAEENMFASRPVVLAGRNGYAAVRRSRDFTQIDTLAFCNASTGAWTQPELTAPLINTKAYAFAEEAPLFAAVDGEHTVRVWDMKTGKETAAFPLQLPYNSVIHMAFLLNDSCLMVKTKEAKVLVFDIASGEILLQDQVDATYSGKLTARTDSAGKRLYIMDDSPSGINTLCVDLESWTVLARAEKVLFYQPQTDELYYTDGSYQSEAAGFYSFRMPTLDALVAKGQQVLEKGSIS